MKRSPAGAARACLLLLAVALLATVRPSAAATTLPDSAILARVGTRVITVYDFRDRFFSSEGQTRPGPDSAGRVTFLNTMIDRDVMAQTVLGLNQPLDLEERLMLRGFESNELARVYYSRRVLDSIQVTEKELKEIYPQHQREMKLRYLLVDGKEAAEKLRTDLVHGRISWKEAARRYSYAPDSLVEGDLGWMSRSKMSGRTAVKVFDLQPTGYSEVLASEDGYRIWQCVDRRSVDGPTYQGVRRFLLEDLRSVAKIPRAERFYAEMRARADAKFDTANIVWLAEQFQAANKAFLTSSPSMATVDLRSTRAPALTEADTGRVLVTTKHGAWSIERVMTEYRAAPSLTRTRILGFSALFGVVQRMALQEDIADAAREHGFEKDPSFMAEVAKIREAMLVERMYADSVESQLRVSEAKRRTYYDKHRQEFVTRQRVRYAMIPRRTEAGADSVVARLAAGASPYDVIREDSLHAWRGGVVREILEGEPHDYRALLFEELKTGQSSKVRLGKEHLWAVFHVVAHEASRPMAYTEVQNIVDESVQNIESERLLTSMLARLRKRYRIDAHPELLMQVALTDPAGDWSIPSGE